MIRNFIIGTAWGGVLAGIGLALLSQLAPMPAEPDAAPSIGQAETTTQTPQTLEAAPEIAANAEIAALSEVAPAATGSETRPTAEQPVVTPDPSTNQAPDLGKPMPDDELAIVAPEADTPKALIEAPLAPEPPSAVQAVPAAALPNADSRSISLLPQPKPSTPLAEQPPEAAELPPPAAPQTAEPLLEPTPKPKASVDPAAIAPEPIENPAPAANAADDEPAAAEIPTGETQIDEPPSETNSPEPSTLAPDTGLNEPIEGVTTGRLPSIASGTAPEPAAEPSSAGSPLDRYAREFENLDNKPLFAIVLMDNGAADLDRAQLAALPFPVSFVIDPLSARAATASSIYRAAGQEVLMLATGIPTGATPADLEQTFQAHAEVLPEAVAVLDLADGGFQNDRPLSTQVVPILKAQGRGLVTFDVGLNAADQVARREDLPAVTIFRYLDAEDEDVMLIRRYLDRAAFKAAQDGRVVVLGQAQPRTIAALLEWTVEGRAASVALAPASAVLRGP